MTALDTNVLVRFFAQDDPAQCRLADKLMQSLSSAKPAWVSLPVLLELFWVLTTSYQVGRQEMVRILDGLLDREEFRIEQIDTVHDALARYRGGKADFADCLITASARAAGCSRTVTFDRVAARDAGMELIG